MEHKECYRCHATKPTSEFYGRGGGRKGFQAWCKACNNVIKKEWYRANPKRAKELAAAQRLRGVGWKSRLKRDYGMTPCDYAKMLIKQDGACAVCRGAQMGHKSKRFFVDHCHKTGVVRGLLCAWCNAGLGSFQDSPDRLAAAIKYLQKHAKLTDTTFSKVSA